jgi:hypothetical protein
MNMKKGALYRTNGARMVWLVIPKTQRVQVYDDGVVIILTKGDALSGGDMPGFISTAGDMFEE